MQHLRDLAEAHGHLGTWFLSLLGHTLLEPLWWTDRSLCDKRVLFASCRFHWYGTGQDGVCSGRWLIPMIDDMA